MYPKQQPLHNCVAALSFVYVRYEFESRLVLDMFCAFGIWDLCVYLNQYFLVLFLSVKRQVFIFSVCVSLCPPRQSWCFCLYCSVHIPFCMLAADGSKVKG